MKVIVCLDNFGGMMFNRRRQSRDRNVVADIISELNGGTLYIAQYSKNLFEKYENVVIDNDFLIDRAKDDTVFVENRSLAEYYNDIDILVTYLWNRDYPSDKKLDIPLDETVWELIDTNEFAGYSHEKITKNIYRKRINDDKTKI